MTAKWEESRLMIDEEIRDTNPHTGTAAPLKADELPDEITFIVENTHDQSVSVQMQGCRESGFAIPVNLGDPIVVAAGDVTPQGGYGVLTKGFFPFIRPEAICSVLPTKGNVNVYEEALSR